MDLITYIATPISGAIIGYLTNVIAIKMLFRPHERKYIFGRKLPFTPGLIPRERFNLSKKIGETLYLKVLTGDVMQNSVASPEMIKKLNNAVNSFIDKLYLDERTIKEIEIFSDEKFLISLSENISAKAISIIDNSAFFEKTAGFLYEKALELLKSKDLHISFSDKTINEIFMKNYSGSIKNFIERKLPSAISWLQLLVENGTKLDESLRSLVKNTAEENFGKFLGIFVNYDKIYDNMKKSAFEYMENQENQQILLDKLFEWADAETSLTVNEFLLKYNLSTKLYEILIDFFEGKEKKEAISKKIQELISKGAKNQLPLVLNKYANELPNMEIRDVMLTLFEGKKEFIKQKLQVMAKFLLEKCGGYIVKSLEFDKIVEQKINDFSVPEAENIILSVVKRELNAITMVGGVLGFVIGLTPVVLMLLGL